MHNALKVFVLLAASLGALVFAVPQASAASAGATTLGIKDLMSGSSTSSPVQKVQFFRCQNRNFVCRRRFGRGGDYRRCMRRAGCGVFLRNRRRCARVNRVCRRRFGRGPDYRRCMVRRRCLRFYR